VPLAILVSLIVLTCAAWALTFYQAASMNAADNTAMDERMAAESMVGMAMNDMEGMSVAGWSLAGLAIFLVVWTVMMIAMMLPAACR
jgi:predicted metal-binding membrane protein